MTKPPVIEALEALGVKVYHTGSRAIMESPPETSDDDWVVLNDPGVMDILDEHGFKPKGGDNSSGGPNTVPWYNVDRTINVILCFEPETFRRWVKATDEAKRLKLNDRADRVALFKRYRVDGDNEEIPF